MFKKNQLKYNNNISFLKTSIFNNKLLLYVCLFSIFFILSLLSVRKVINLKGGIAFYDLIIPSLDEYYADYYPLWNNVKSYTTLNKLPIFIPFFLFYVIGKIFNLQPVNFFIFVYSISGAITGFSSFFCLRYFLEHVRTQHKYNEIYASLIGSLFYYWSTFRLSHTSHLFMIFVYGIIPIIYISYLKGMFEKKILFITISAALLSMSGLRLFIYIIPFLIFHSILHIVLNHFKNIKSNIKMIGLFLLLFFLFSSYWIIPTIQHTKDIQQKTITYEEIELHYRNSNPIGILTLNNNWITPDRYYLGQIQYSSLTLIIIAISFICLIKNERNKGNNEIYIISIHFLVTFLLLLGPNYEITRKLFFSLIYDLPFSSMYGWAFRTPKIIEMFMLFTSILFTISIYDVFSYLSKIKKNTVRNILTSLVAIFLLTTILLPVWPLSTGDLNGALGKNFTYIRNYNNESGSLRSIFLGKTPLSFPYSYNVKTYDNPIFEHYNLFLSYLLERQDSIPNSYVSPINIDTIFYYDSGGDIKSIKYDPNDKMHITFPIKIIGPLSMYNSFQRISNTREISPIFSEQFPSITLELEDLIIRDGNELFYSIIFNTLKDSITEIIPSKYSRHYDPNSKWSISGSNLLYNHLEKRDIINFDFYYGKGLVYTFGPPKSASLEIPYSVPKTDDYVLLIRVYNNQMGGKISIQNDDETYTIYTKNQLNKFSWEQIDTHTLKEGQHKIILTNLEGFNSVNLFLLLPKQDYENASKHVTDALQDKRIVHILEAESDFIHENTTRSIIDGSVSDLVLELTPDSKIGNSIATIKPENYMFSIKSKGNLLVKIDDVTHSVTSTKLNWSYIGPVNLERGIHTIDLTTQPTYHTEWNFESYETLEWKNSVTNTHTLNLHKKSYSGNTSLLAELDASTWGWKHIDSPAIPVTPNAKYSWSFKISGENAHSIHAKIVEHDKDLEPLVSKRVINIGNGTFNWTHINFEYTPSFNASFITLQIWHGHETTQPLPNRIWIDEVEVTGYIPTELDAVCIYTTELNNETLVEVFENKKISADIIQYSMINPTKYHVNINASEPFMLSFAEAYDPLWVARVDDEKITSIPLYSVINGFWIEKSGYVEVTIEYMPQKWFYIGSAISFTTILITILYLFIPYIKQMRTQHVAYSNP